MLTPEGLLLPDADKISRRADDHILPLRRMHVPVEGKLRQCRCRVAVGQPVCFFFCFCLVLSFLAQGSLALDNSDAIPFTVVLFMCVWKRPLLTEFVLSHYHKMRPILMNQGIELDIFITGSDNQTTLTLARKFMAPYAVHPNSPLGAKHDKGIQSVRDHFKSAVSRGDRSRLPDAVTIVGSDDVINDAFFLRVKELMRDQLPQLHVVGLQDIYFHDLKSRRLVYTRGYRSFRTPISGTLGCGRVFSWSILDALDWHVWDLERERGLDQSAIRNVMRHVPFVGAVSGTISGRDSGILAVDIKSDGFAAGANIWRFDEVVEAVGKSGRLHDFVDYDTVATLGHAFGSPFLSDLDSLRTEMASLESE